MNKKEKITEYLYLKAVNQSERKKKYPKDISNLDKEVSSIGIEYLPTFDNASIRVQFFGSKMFFSLPISNDKMEYWLAQIKEFKMVEDEVDFENIIIEDDDVDEFAVVP